MITKYLFNVSSHLQNTQTDKRIAISKEYILNTCLCKVIIATVDEWLLNTLPCVHSPVALSQLLANHYTTHLRMETQFEEWLCGKYL